MDALPIEEETGVQYASTNPGVMHACGHDAHTAMLLGAARLLRQRENELTRSVRLIFQPHEELFPGGAPAMIAGGALVASYLVSIFSPWGLRFGLFDLLALALGIYFAVTRLR